VLFLGNGSLVFDIDNQGRGTSFPNKIKLWDEKYCASDSKSKYFGKEK